MATYFAQPRRRLGDLSSVALAKEEGGRSVRTEDGVAHAAPLTFRFVPGSLRCESGVESLNGWRKVPAMRTVTEEIIRLCEALPADKRTEVADFARFLLSGSAGPGDAVWEQRLADPRPLRRLDMFLNESAAEGRDEPLDPKRL